MKGGKVRGSSLSVGLITRFYLSSQTLLYLFQIVYLLSIVEQPAGRFSHDKLSCVLGIKRHYSVEHSASGCSGLACLPDLPQLLKKDPDFFLVSVPLNDVSRRKY